MGELDTFLGNPEADTTPAEPTGETIAPPAPAEPTPPPADDTAPPAEQQQGQPRDERGRWAPKPGEAAPQGTPPVAGTPDEHPQTVPVAALREERRKRQELEARWAQLQQQYPQITDDNFYASPVAASQQMIGQQTQVLQQQIQNIRYELAEDFTRAQHEDYDNVREAFVAKYESHDPWAIAVASQMGAMPNPAKFVYDQTKRQMTIGDDPRAYEERVRADERAKVLKEFQQQQRPAAPAVPQSLNSEPSEMQAATSQSFEPTPLTNIIPHNY